MPQLLLWFIAALNACNGMNVSSQSFQINNRICLPSTSEKAENVGNHSERYAAFPHIKQASKFDKIKISKTKQNMHPILAHGKAFNKIPAEGMPTRFSYENQLKIILENRKTYEFKHTKIALQIHGRFQTAVPDNVYHIFALHAAIINENKLITMKTPMNETEHILRIVASMRSAIMSINRSATKTLSSVLINEQLRFIGLVHGHLLFRDNPIFDEANNEFHFCAKIEPNIDALNRSECNLVINQFDQQLHAQLIGENLASLEKEEENFCELFENFEKKVAKGRLEAGDSEKRVELVQKSLLLTKYGPDIPYFPPIMRAFIIFGVDATKLIILYRALLGGYIDGPQLDEYLNDYFQSKTLKLATNCNQSIILENQLKSLWKQYGLL